MSKNMYSLTNPQKSIWQTEQFYKGTSIENIAGTATILEKVDFKKFEKAINLFIEKNDNFRLKFIIENDEIKQYVEDYSYISFEKVLVSSEKEIKKVEDELSNFVFNTLDSFLFKFKLFEFPDGHGGFVITMHHLISDAWTSGIVISEIINLYDALINNEDISCEKAPSYLDYISSEKEYINSEKFEKDKVFWNNLFESIPDSATIPSRNSSSKISSKAKRKEFTISKEMLALIKDFCKSNKISEFNFFMGILALYLGRVTSLDELVIGTPILNRSNFKEKHTAGMFISVVPFKVCLNSENSFAEFASTISKDFFSIFKHQKYSYQDLLEDLRNKHGNNIPNLFNILFSYQNMRSNKQTARTNYDSKWLFNNNISDDLEIHMYDINDTGSVLMAYDYKTEKYSIEDIYSIHERFLHIINQILENTNILLKDIEIVTPDEKNKILYNFNNTQADYPKDKTITQLFEEQVEKTPNNIAVVFENEQLTYKELNEKANSLANYLLDIGLTTKSNVGIFTSRSLNSIIGILAILKLNCTYVPIDPTYPIDRIEYMISNSSISYILKDNSVSTLKNINGNISIIHVEQNVYSNFPRKFTISQEFNPDNNLYIIFTSGSTGKPKGVTISHKNMINLITFEKNKTSLLQNAHNILQFATMSFDVSYQEIYSALLNGLTLVLINDDIRKNVNTLSEYIDTYSIDTLFIPPAYLKLLADNHLSINLLIKNVKNIVTAGEKLVITNGIKKLLSNNIKIHNHYGPAETHVATAYVIESTTSDLEPPIGKPISNSRIYILDNNNRLLPNNIIGQIAISGDCVGNGYINNPTYTKERFIEDPFFNDVSMYLTGDLGYIDEDGLIHFLGRNDFQVKVNGFRIELEEIETALHSYPNITNCIVITQKDLNHTFIIAYYLSKEDIDESILRTYLRDKLPHYMMPHYLIKLDTMPYNINGKIDRKQLPKPNIEIRNKEIILPRNETDKILIALLNDLLDIETISIDDSFFELGGDSLTAINLCAKIYSKFNVQIFVKDILENPIVKDLSDLIDTSANTIVDNIKLVKTDKQDFYPVSSAQKRTYYSTKKISDDNLVYNVSGALLADKLLNINKIKNVFAQILEIHPSFRTRFVLKDEELVQEIVDIKNVNIDVFNDSEKNMNNIINNFPKPFDLSKAPLLRVSVCLLDNKKTLILSDTHHIIMDGVSLNILMRDFCKLYNDEEIEKSDFDYIDYSVWENNYINSEETKNYDKYWSSVCANTDVPVLNLPYDYPATNSKTYTGDKITYTMQKDIFEKLQELSNSLNISEYTLFLTALYIVLYKYTSQTDLIVASPLAGRNFEEISNIIGMFVNNIILRKTIDATDSVSALLKSVQNTVSDSISNQPYPYELVAKKLNNNSSLLDVVLTYQNTKKDEYKIENSKLELIPADTKTSKFNIWLEIIPDIFTFNLEYNCDLFKKETIESFLNHYIFILNQMLENVDIKVDDLEILTQNELDLLDNFNNTDAPINDDTVVSIFEEQVKKHPNNIALICEDKALTYKELNKKANSLAHHLIEKGIKANDIVCIMTNRSLETVVSMMGILKAGAAFFNVDPTYPIERTKYYLEDSKTRYVLTQKELRGRVEAIENCIEIDLNIDDIYSKNFKNPNLKIEKEDLSYLIYTSGSTGKPKGTMLNHVGFANMVKAMTLVLDYLKEGNKHCIASVTSTPFDIFVYEIIVSLTHGLKIAMANNAEHRNPKLLDKLIRKYNVDVMTVTPSLMKINYDNREPNTALAMVKNMVFGGEPLPEKFVEDLRALADDITIYNIYGPSEITILSNVQNLDGETEITTGPPIMNTQIHILDKNMKRVPVGVVGEIYISGIQVGLGYIGKPELTAEKFLDNPFGEGKMYKSGDIGRWTFDGKVQCLGRIDHQIKLRGLRIELGEIENVMLNIEGVSSAVVNKIEIDGNEFLCGYYATDKIVEENLVRDILRKALPPYMVPTYFVKLEKMPYTINRKIDRKALPMPDLNKPVVNSKVNIEELNSSEEKLLQIWKNILKIEDISINDNFFDIGGDSVAAISMQIEAVKYGLDFEYSNIFTHPTIKELSKKSNRSDEEFIRNYDYKKLKEILNRNNFDNLKTIKKSKIKNILLVGATGYLGAHILDAFMKSKKGTVYCLVRPKNNIDIEQRLKDTLNFYFGNKYDKEFSKRIKVVHGDIVESNLGLSEENFNMLSNDIDAIINSGALVKHFGIKKKFEEINVNGTKNIIDFCTKTNKRLLHISTISISGNGEKEEIVVETPENINKKKLFKETNIYVGQNIKGVYSTTKFRAELLVLEAISNGLDAQILRMGNITNRYSDGVFQMNADENAFAKRIKSFIEINAFPKYLLPHSIELTPVDLATEAIIKILNHKSVCNVFHIYNTKLLPIKLLMDTLNNDLNIDLLAVSDTMMKDILTGILADNDRKDILSGIIYDLDENKNLIYTSNVRLICHFTEKYLNKLGFRWKKIDKEYIIRYMNYLRKINFI